MNSKWMFFLIAVITVCLFALSLFGLQIGDLNLKGANQMRYGIDIRGGVDATYEPKDLGRAPTADELNAAKSIIETRMDALNINDRDVTVDLISGKIIVRFPWKSNEASFDPQKAVSELGETARLTFRDPDGNVVLEGSDVARSYPSTSPVDGTPIVSLELSAEGTTKFSDATSKLIGKEISIYMDENEISSPRVDEQISGGKAYISHIGSMDEAKSLSDKINSGSLPFSMIVKNCNIISPTLGSGALSVMVLAGEVAFALVCLFMLLYYRLPGFVACIVLLLQVTGQLLMLSVGQFTLTLAGIAGIILSIGMGVDVNVITNERIREELTVGKSHHRAVDAGFDRAFSAVFDGNITVIIVAVILIIFGSGALLSFGYTLLFGVIMNFIAIAASRLMLQSLISYNGLRKPGFFGVRRSAQ